MILRLLLRGAQRLRCIDGWAATSPFLLRQRTRVYELTARQVVDFLWGRLPAQNGVAMRMTTEAGNYVSMSTRLRHRVLQYPAQLRRRLFRELLRELDRTLQVQELLGMPQGQKEEGRLRKGRQALLLDEWSFEWCPWRTCRGPCEVSICTTGSL